MSSSWSLSQPVCEIPTGLRTREEQETCADTERGIGLTLTGIGTALIMVLIITTPNRSVTHRFGKIGAVALGGILVGGIVYIVHNLRMREWVAQKTAMKALLKDPAATNVWYQKQSADAAARYEMASVASTVRNFATAGVV